MIYFNVAVPDLYFVKELINTHSKTRMIKSRSTESFSVLI